MEWTGHVYMYEVGYDTCILVTAYFSDSLSHTHSDSRSRHYAVPQVSWTMRVRSSVGRSRHVQEARAVDVRCAPTQRSSDARQRQRACLGRAEDEETRPRRRCADAVGADELCRLTSVSTTVVSGSCCTSGTTCHAVRGRGPMGCEGGVL